MALDLVRRDDRDAFLAMIDTADVFLESSARGDRAPRIDPDALPRRNPALVYCSITAYGADNGARRPAGLRVASWPPEPAASGPNGAAS